MLEKTRVLILTTAYLPQIGGSELAIKNTTDRLPEIKFDLITSQLSKDVPEYERIGDVNVYRVGEIMGLSSFLLPKNFFPISVFLKAVKLIRKQGHYDVIHAYQASQAAGGGWLLKWVYPKTPFLLTIQEGKDLNRQPWLMRFLRHFIFRKADVITVISNYLAQYVRSQNSKVPISIIPNGVDVSKFKPEGEHNSKVIITSSRLVKKNGIGDLVDAIAVVKKEVPDIKLLVVGSGEQAKELKTKSSLLGLENNIEFIGEVPNDLLPQYLAKASIFVRPSLSEGLGIAFLEAMAAGLPVVATPVGGIPDFLKDGETGLFCKVGDPEDIAEKINTILSDDNLRNRLITNGRKLVEAKYTWDKISDKFRELYLEASNNEQ
ncbi:MAG: hypothetical protein A2651_03330 [Candidatus Yanofskybacteria bacterium RIFCSPHIGHO2_01_FULL_42_12]|uniref:Glycosyl transferase family 1 domain-containing protein n=1 Tax=Candidatus Yanofskybacteria bacterium RIFCSPLOWO2_01_FULL_42_49 TaxID=1802694 RepID=A0A1F8G9Z4_9BACT|nr:MAG: hypothetical protein A2651_03330 [Candidatus Yanofskybacteria bacterium RIFCSPHIGHO2_01_FULL_42_12]OGN22192.1 MAG: hypothetical protein A2918_03465 [Candidatus Yanofskybacteria bacterium RIFCSPLOWO2_01_FULL_42_49]